MSKGLIHVYTGTGKGKTTAALGLALRATGHAWKVKMIQFMKGDPDYGEIAAARGLPNLEIIQSGLESFVDKDNPSSEDIRLADAGLQMAEEAFNQPELDLLIMDEINVALNFNLIPLEKVLLSTWQLACQCCLDPRIDTTLYSILTAVEAAIKGQPGGPKMGGVRSTEYRPTVAHPFSLPLSAFPFHLRRGVAKNLVW